MSDPQVSIIFPTLNEAENLPLLIPRIAAAMAAGTYEILIVDDSSPDRTPDVCAALARRYPLRLIVREPKDGLAGAVLHGLREAAGGFLVVMDADLQHPPESIPELLRPLQEDRADFTLGSRYTAGGSTKSEWSLLRRVNSKAATFLARPFAGDAHDPMSGFFALHRETFARARHLTPIGYKVGLELMCKCGARRVVEVPIHFATRHAGQSKLTVRQQFKYLEHLSRLYDFFFPRISPVIKFLIATASAWLVGFAVYLLALAKSRADGLVAPPPAIAIAYAAAIIATAVFHVRYTRTQREFLIRPRPWRDFAMISLCEWAAAAGMAVFCSRRIAHITPLELFLYCFAAATTTRYVLRKEFLQDVRGLRTELRPEKPAPVGQTFLSALEESPTNHSSPSEPPHRTGSPRRTDLRHRQDAA
ncbi:MAG TPA: polyprenol monophosphomannose synthase [Tepidisphaeraceae bacterium]